MPNDIREIAAAAVLFGNRFEVIKRAHQSPEFGWYPYDSFAVFPILSRMLKDDRRDLLHLAGAAPIIDIGCGDGGLSFFFESLGCRVTAIDSPASNYNRTLGFAALRTALNSSVEFKDSDIDRSPWPHVRTGDLSGGPLSSEKSVRAARDIGAARQALYSEHPDRTGHGSRRRNNG